MADYPSWVKPHLRQRLEQERIQKSTQNKHPDAKTTPTPGAPINPQPAAPQTQPTLSFGLKRGDRVRVVNNNYDWWVDSMDKYDGQWLTVLDTDGGGGCFNVTETAFGFHVECVVEVR